MLQTLGNALSVSRYLNLLQRYADFVSIAHRSNIADSSGSGFLLTGPGWIYKSPAFYAQALYGRAAGTHPLRVEQPSSLAWQLREPDLSVTLSEDGRTLRVYAVNSTLQAMATQFQLEGFASSVEGGTVYTLEDHEHALTAEVMNSRDEPERVSFSAGKAEISGKAFEFSFKPLSVTLLELKLSK